MMKCRVCSNIFFLLQSLDHPAVRFGAFAVSDGESGAGETWRGLRAPDEAQNAERKINLQMKQNDFFFLLFTAQ